MQTIIDALSKNIGAPLASVYTIYATSFAALAVVIAFIKLYHVSLVNKYNLGHIWPIRGSIFIAMISIVALQIVSLFIITLNLENSCKFYYALKISLIFSWLSLLMLGVIYHFVLRVAVQMLKYFDLAKE